MPIELNKDEIDLVETIMDNYRYERGMGKAGITLLNKLKRELDKPEVEPESMQFKDETKYED